MKTTKEIAKEIRAALKSKGWNARKVSVRTEHYTVDAAISITIKDLDVPIDVVEEIAAGRGHIDRCQVTGEILCGGNLYVDVAYDREALDARAADLAAKLEALPEGERLAHEGLTLYQTDRYTFAVDAPWLNIPKHCHGAHHAAKVATVETLKSRKGEAA